MKRIAILSVLFASLASGEAPAACSGLAGSYRLARNARGTCANSLRIKVGGGKLSVVTNGSCCGHQIDPSRNGYRPDPYGGAIDPNVGYTGTYTRTTSFIKACSAGEHSTHTNRLFGIIPTGVEVRKLSLELDAKDALRLRYSDVGTTKDCYYYKN